ncbi:hypothetical protein HPP92_017350 [Vanilla planifolia]|uniref:Uncharacterized protein n=1 Tax=Vanilla planifolia TaxID=51239 RepID=A0A835UNC6_VANPL|nr:hypothetical protein HPP92_017350 [Vanilla planifolia]
MKQGKRISTSDDDRSREVSIDNVQMQIRLTNLENKKPSEDGNLRVWMLGQEFVGQGVTIAISQINV